MENRNPIFLALPQIVLAESPRGHFTAFRESSSTKRYLPNSCQSFSSPEASQKVAPPAHHDCLQERKIQRPLRSFCELSLSGGKTQSIQCFNEVAVTSAAQF